MWASLIEGFVKGIIQPLLQWWSTYNQGRNAQRAEDATASLSKQQEVEDAVARARADAGHYYVDADGRVRRQLDLSASPGVPPPPRPDSPPASAVLR